MKRNSRRLRKRMMEADHKKEQKMKIAILSMQRIVNFGSVLQAYSLRGMIQSLTDLPVVFLDIDEGNVLESQKSIRESVDYEQPAAYPPGIWQKGKRWLIARLSAYNKRLIRTFMSEELKLDAQNSQQNYDLVAVGSDEVFNHARGINLQLHGQVPQAKTVISYAAACGSASAEDILPEDVERVKRAMSCFQAVSVRDSATQAYAAKLYDGKIERHLDPVLVGDLYRREHRRVFLKKYLLVYAYGQRIRTREEIDAIRNYAKAHGLKTVAMGGSQFWCDLYLPASPMRMLDYFYHADAVVTDTFHGVVFSVINHKPFAVILRKTNQNKLDGLLADLGLTDRKLSAMPQLEDILSAKPDYDAVDAILGRERQRARAYLAKQLGVEHGTDEAAEE